MQSSNVSLSCTTVATAPTTSAAPDAAATKFGDPDASNEVSGRVP
jgi:hypothetical protein